VGVSSILTILSPVLRPALYAGVSSMGETIVNILSLVVISIPSPPKFYLSSLPGVPYKHWGGIKRRMRIKIFHHSFN